MSYEFNIYSNYEYYAKNAIWGQELSLLAHDRMVVVEEDLGENNKKIYLRALD